MRSVAAERFGLLPIDNSIMLGLVLSRLALHGAVLVHKKFGAQENMKIDGPDGLTIFPRTEEEATFIQGWLARQPKFRGVSRRSTPDGFRSYYIRPKELTINGYGIGHVGIADAGSEDTQQRYLGAAHFSTVDFGAAQNGSGAELLTVVGRPAMPIPNGMGDMLVYLMPAQGSQNGTG